MATNAIINLSSPSSNRPLTALFWLVALAVFFVALACRSGLGAQQKEELTDTPPIPTPTPGPTATPRVIDGSADSVVDITIAEPVLLRIAGNAESRNFTVTDHGPDGQQNLLVNVLEPYTGIRPLNFTNPSSRRLEIKATGSWHIELWPVSSARRIAVPGEIQGAGDDVLIIEGTPNTATISGNQAARNFVVIGYRRLITDLLVNVLDLYEGTVVLDPETVLLEIKATGSWRIAIK